MKTKATIPLLLQDSIDLAMLQSFIDMRNEDTRKPMTQRALDMLIRKLSELETQGHCPNLLLQKSIISTYQDVYPSDDTRRPVSFAQQHSDRKWADGIRLVK